MCQFKVGQAKTLDVNVRMFADEKLSSVNHMHWRHDLQDVLGVLLGLIVAVLLLLGPQTGPHIHFLRRPHRRLP